MGMFTKGKEKAPVIARTPEVAQAPAVKEKKFASKEAAVLFAVTEITKVINCYGEGKGQFNGSAMVRCFNESCLPVLKSAVADGYFDSLEDALKNSSVRETMKSLQDEIKAANKFTEDYFAKYVK